jgi:hypothetical protein
MSIKLTEEQKDKILEMCKVLFPEYDFVFYHTISKANMLTGFLKTNDSDLYDNCDIFIHWFEFCMTHLAEKIAKHDRYDDLNLHVDTILACWVNHTENFPRKHPVDYLYEKFKRIKNENT